ncbi:platelet-activating factor acetylhydrolase IB subunit [Singulisphaera acidiphila]|uniref:Lysophospholipase L1-like esterase n=1 Tax=Singulisphaera acidiphila (strain ATCC BAA-1392 / DSM 18658 / VKM B-2454 / MOB10) TaxID=886293 RepID=L0DI14_SINAD|nr:platelet-activating factor acetylhydrolase IB subunit [Singulisphaera acidiphila]AGA29034.1 lysophospholipase L1-like esterase [Singulisphaera acidiphila DSM 18658]
MHGLSGSLRNRSLVLAIALSTVVTGQTAWAQAQAAPESSTMPAPRTGPWMKLHKAFLERAKQGKIDLLFLGDSITNGWGGHDNNGAGPIEVWERHFAPRNAANFGIGGDRTQHVLWRIENGEVDGISPKVVILMIGTNNTGANTSDEIAEGIEAIVKSLRQRLSTTKILLLAVFPRGEKPGPIREKLAAVNDRIAKLDDGQMVKYLDIGPKFLNEDGTISKEIMPDSLHLKRKGYRIWADAIEPTLWSMLDEESVEPSQADGAKTKP